MAERFVRLLRKVCLVQSGERILVLGPLCHDNGAHDANECNEGSNGEQGDPELEVGENVDRFVTG